MTEAFYEAVERAGHKLRRNPDGKIDALAMYAGYCNGPACELCHDAWCEHCTHPDKIEPCDGGIDRARARLDGDRRQWERLVATYGQGGPAFQARVQPWMMTCFGPEISADRIERGDRFAEEAFELLQAGGYDPARLPALIDYVWGRPAGEPAQEAGGVMVTLAAYCLAHGLDMHEAGETELARISRPEVVEKIRAKQAAKARDIPLSPLPAAPANPANPADGACCHE